MFLLLPSERAIIKTLFSESQVNRALIFALSPGIATGVSLSFCVMTVSFNDDSDSCFEVLQPDRIEMAAIAHRTAMINRLILNSAEVFCLFFFLLKVVMIDVFQNFKNLTVYLIQLIDCRLHLSHALGH